MPISTQCINSYINACAGASPNCLQTQQLTGAAIALENAAIGYSVANIASLPSAADNEGRMVYVEDIGAYRYSNGLEWTNDYSSVREITETYIYNVGCDCSNRIMNESIGSITISPVRESSNSTNWTQVCNARNATIGLKADGTLWGSGACGLHGGSTYNDVASVIQEVRGFTDWCFINAGTIASFAIRTDTTLWSAGYSTCNLRLRSGNSERYCLSDGGSTGWLCASIVLTRNQAGLMSALLKNDGTLYTVGCNIWGSLGLNSTIDCCAKSQEICSASNWCDMSARGLHVNAIKTDGTLWAWGRNNFGQLGLNDAVDHSAPAQVGVSTDWCSTETAESHSMAIKTDGTLWTWGDNTYGELGNNDVACTSSPVQEVTSSTDWCKVGAGWYHSNAIKTDGTLWHWGRGCPGTNGDCTSINRSSPIENSQGWTWCDVSGGIFQVSAIRSIIKGFDTP